MNELRATHDQRFLSENNEPGDCWRTCIASLLGLPRDEVPHFMEQAANAIGLYSWAQMKESNKAGPWRDITERWLNKRGYTLRDFEPMTWNEETEGTAWDWSAAPVRYMLLTGKSPRGEYLHTIIVDTTALAREEFGAAVAHDPHPSRAGVEYAVDCFYIVEDSTVVGELTA